MPWLFRHAAFAAALIATVPALAQTAPAAPGHRKPPAPARPAAAAPAPKAQPVALPDPPIPTQHATQAGMGRCVRAIDQLSRAELGSP